MNSVPTKNFYNDGFGWICRKCEQERTKAPRSSRSRFMTEGEAEFDEPLLSTFQLAKWADRSEGVLKCPTCGTVGRIDQNR